MRTIDKTNLPGYSGSLGYDQSSAPQPDPTPTEPTRRERRDAQLTPLHLHLHLATKLAQFSKQ